MDISPANAALPCIPSPHTPWCKASSTFRRRRHFKEMPHRHNRAESRVAMAGGAPCRFWLRGSCRFGNECVHPHPGTCTHWLRGACQFGTQCKQRHVADASTPCPYWRRGTCRYGARCALAHSAGDSDNVAPRRVAHIGDAPSPAPAKDPLHRFQAQFRDLAPGLVAELWEAGDSNAAVIVALQEASHSGYAVRVGDAPSPAPAKDPLHRFQAQFRDLAPGLVAELWEAGDSNAAVIVALQEASRGAGVWDEEWGGRAPLTWFLAEYPDLDPDVVAELWAGCSSTRDVSESLLVEQERLYSAAGYVPHVAAAPWGECRSPDEAVDPPPPAPAPPATEDAEKECVICLERPRGVILYPCGHRCACVACADRLSRCPVCRAEIEYRAKNAKVYDV
eukprot:TRINITY_DN6624_c0_g4_i1.p1 TRINITY_DN6624_c0_g4~~TRINITY_DN6624_c0_g4_i1.p1  ORF type:complete len:393 (+),score=49.86 TRINITY_DN6624_c0_g4_i1:1164-2342(+)